MMSRFGGAARVGWVVSGMVLLGAGLARAEAEASVCDDGAAAPEEACGAGGAQGAGGRCGGGEGPCAGGDDLPATVQSPDHGPCGVGGLACMDGEPCAEAADCASGVCWNGYCAIPSCGDGVVNGDESDVDCGGPCAACGEGRDCFAAADCASGVCVDGVCAFGTCDDGLANGDESGVDCGGATCGPCAVGEGCFEGTDCDSLVCVGGACQPASCADGVPNGAETDVDCGGGCGACEEGQACAAGADCASEVCAQGMCAPAGCADGVQNGDETGLDCGGSCAPCPVGAGCVDGDDCASGTCVLARCQPPACGDGVANGFEGVPDCGGPCAPCAGEVAEDEVAVDADHGRGPGEPWGGDDLPRDRARGAERRREVPGSDDDPALAPARPGARAAMQGERRADPGGAVGEAPAESDGTSADASAARSPGVVIVPVVTPASPAGAASDAGCAAGPRGGLPCALALLALARFFPWRLRRPGSPR